MTKLLCFLVGLVLFLAGLASLPFPIPGGLFATALGLVLLIYSSPGVEAGVRAARGRYSWVHRSVSWLEVRVGERVGGVLQTTRPKLDTPAEGPQDRDC